MARAIDHEPGGTHQTKKATASGWIGSALEYYDFFIHATAASETYRVHMNDLGDKDAVPVPREEYDRMRTPTMVGNKDADSKLRTST